MSPDPHQSRFSGDGLEIQSSFSTQETEDGKIICLGREFDSDHDRRTYYRNRLKEGIEELEGHLSGIEFTGHDVTVKALQNLEHWDFGGDEGIERLARGVERRAKTTRGSGLLELTKDELGFPEAETEAILRLSDPPYYTACPNPFIGDLIEEYGQETDYEEEYSREPFATDVSQGKHDRLYQAHGYHTKVPHKAIIPAILHYTDPGDVVLDGFCGAGMTGLAAHLCGNPTDDFRIEVEERFENEGRDPPKWGPRRSIQNDLAPSATFIASNYNIPFDINEFEDAANSILSDLEDEIGWMYETAHTDGRPAQINYTVWSEVFSCPECGGEFSFMEEAFDPDEKEVLDEFNCPTCNTLLTKKKCEHLTESVHDPLLDRVVKIDKREPVLINYEIDGETYEKTPDEEDLARLEKIEQDRWPMDFPSDRMMHAPPAKEKWGDKWRAGTASFTHVHHLFLPRPAYALSHVWKLAEGVEDDRLRHMLLFFVEQSIWGLSVLNRYAPKHFSQTNRYLSGVYYVSSQHSEVSPWYNLENKLKRLVSAFNKYADWAYPAGISTGNCARTPTPSTSVDYVFTDPPFGDNLAYAELNFLVEAFHEVFTRTEPEAIVSDAQEKGLEEYESMMQSCFSEYYRVLKPGRWMTVVFHNSKNSVWNTIQEAILQAGFVIADVRTLDKQQSSFNQVVAGGSVKQDLVISAYKPSEQLEETFTTEIGTEENVWEFVENHLRQLPIFVKNTAGDAEVIAERQDFLLFDRMVAFHLQRGLTVPLSAAEFYAGLEERFEERGGMYFLSDQASEYDRKRTQVTKIEQVELTITDESSAIKWLRGELKRKPKTFQELQPEFMQMVRGWEDYEESIELQEILDQNFLRYDGDGPIPDPLWSWMRQSELLREEMENRSPEEPGPMLKEQAEDRWYVPDPRREADLEKLREKALMKEFESIASESGKVTSFRTEAVRVGFKRLWEQEDYQAILDVAQKLPINAIEDDTWLLMYRDQARSRAATQTEISEEWASDDSA